MLELQDKLSDILESADLTYTEFAEDAMVVSAFLQHYPTFMEVLLKLNNSVYRDKVLIDRNSILVLVPVIWIKGQRYKVRAFVHFDFVSGILKTVYLKPSVYVYTDFNGVTQNFSSFLDMTDTIKDDIRLHAIDLMGELSDAKE